MAKIFKVAPPNSLIFISDISNRSGPEYIPNRLVLATDTVISVGCLANMDGETEIRLGPAHEFSATGAPVFDGVLKTPTRELLVSTVEYETLLSEMVPSQTTRIRIWTNEPVEPDQIAIGWGD
jgi:hypothetical protein